MLTVTPPVARLACCWYVKQASKQANNKHPTSQASCTWGRARQCATCILLYCHCSTPLCADPSEIHSHVAGTLSNQQTNKQTALCTRANWGRALRQLRSLHSPSVPPSSFLLPPPPPPSHPPYHCSQRKPS